ncbi:uncharacterized protein LOC125500888 [Athalia rosae]|uniref:uncharacterized protein LOC125500888 n=1 Tax=Athalia rosae TaxID=37344 RepID=UPI00203383DB|nr:uncharacterized protein LOC125500888 [Athalia rosae]XP_048511000.1 uncharacterized protein LOC125500888 [Athalia rosae]
MKEGCERNETKRNAACNQRMNTERESRWHAQKKITNISIAIHRVQCRLQPLVTAQRTFAIHTCNREVQCLFQSYWVSLRIPDLLGSIRVRPRLGKKSHTGRRAHFGFEPVVLVLHCTHCLGQPHAYVWILAALDEFS